MSDNAATLRLIEKARSLAAQVAQGWESRANNLDSQAASLSEQAAQCRAEAERERDEVEALAKALDCCADPSKPPCSPCEEARRARETDPAVLPPTVTVDSSAVEVARG
jgi:tRNA(Ile)-lysidine synthase TilS/MesJ